MWSREMAYAGSVGCNRDPKREATLRGERLARSSRAVGQAGGEESHNELRRASMNEEALGEKMETAPHGDVSWL